jgi:quinol monooxygenase YgiN
MEISVFARLHAKPGNEVALAKALLEVAPPSQEEPGCVSLQDFQSIRDPRLFFVYSGWKDEAAFEIHARLPHTVRFVELIVGLIDQPLDVVRTRVLE